MLFIELAKMEEEIKKSENMFCIPQSEALIKALLDEWQRFLFLKMIAEESKYPSKSFVKCNSMEEAYYKVKLSNGNDGIFYALEFVAFKNRIVEKACKEIIDKVVEERC